jgi:hypothetical protein
MRMLPHINTKARSRAIPRTINIAHQMITIIVAIAASNYRWFLNTMPFAAWPCPPHIGCVSALKTS